METIVIAGLGILIFMIILTRNNSQKGKRKPTSLIWK